MFLIKQGLRSDKLGSEGADLADCVFLRIRHNQQINPEVGVMLCWQITIRE